LKRGTGTPRRLSGLVLPNGRVAIEIPVEQRHATSAERLFDGVVRAGNETIERHHQGNDHFGHGLKVTLRTSPACRSPLSMATVLPSVLAEAGR
jgi:type VI protein secretion system component VasA